MQTDMITHSLIVAVLESYAMVDKQCELWARTIPDNWEVILVDDGSEPAIPYPETHPAHFQMLRINSNRKSGEWTQHEAINFGVRFTVGDYLVKSDIDHVFTPQAIEAANQFDGDMMLFERRAGIIDNDEIKAIDHPVYSPVDDIWCMKRSLFLERGGYPSTRKYGTAGKAFWDLSRKPEAQPMAGAVIFVTPDTHEKYHSLERQPA